MGSEERFPGLPRSSAAQRTQRLTALIITPRHKWHHPAHELGTASTPLSARNQRESTLPETRPTRHMRAATTRPANRVETFDTPTHRSTGKRVQLVEDVQ